MQNDVDIAYFEAQLLNFEPGTKLAIGLVTRDFVLDNFPGSQSKSYGYHSTGEYWANGRRKGVGLATCNANSVIGCGINYITGKIFFTVDGKVEKVEDRVTVQKWYPCVALHAAGQRVRLNFGRQQFRYNLQEKREELKTIQMADIDEISIPSMSRLIFNFLLFHAYKETAEALAEATMGDLQPLTERDTRMLSTLELRAEMKKLIFAGRVQEAKEALLFHFGDMVAYTEAMFILDCQIFIELIRKKDVMEAIEFSQLCFPNWWCESTFQRIEECCSLLAYFVPQTAPASYLLSKEHLSWVFDSVNRSIFQWTNVFTSSDPFNETTQFESSTTNHRQTDPPTSMDPVEAFSIPSSSHRTSRAPSSRSFPSSSASSSSSTAATSAQRSTLAVPTVEHQTHPNASSSSNASSNAGLHSASLSQAQLPYDEPDLLPLLGHFMKLHSSIRSHLGGGAPFNLKLYAPIPPTPAPSRMSSAAPSTAPTPSILRNSTPSNRK